MNKDLEKAIAESFSKSAIPQIKEKIDKKEFSHTELTNEHGEKHHILKKDALTSFEKDGEEIHFINGKRVTLDPMSVAKHVHNDMTCEIYWRNWHPKKRDRPHVIHKPKTWITLPDQYYVPHLKKNFSDKNEQIHVTEKYGGKI